MNYLIYTRHGVIGSFVNFSYAHQYCRNHVGDISREITYHGSLLWITYNETILLAEYSEKESKIYYKEPSDISLNP